ncbi:MAG TPA: hypothetical protein VLC09_00990 [Polyangiaceae bacterium]|nr:hypothetical protein [Polyangiaceae bacterium]
MLSRPGPLPSGAEWSFEVKWDGFRAIVSTEDGLRVRSRRGWDMTHAVPELEALPPGLVLDGELVAWRDGDPYFADVCARVLNRDGSIPITLIVFDVLRIDGESLLGAHFDERRDLLVGLSLRPPISDLRDVRGRGSALHRGLRNGAGGRRRQADRQHLRPLEARLGEDEESELLAA